MTTKLMNRESLLDRRDAYIARLSAWSRADLLRTCRAAGLTAHKAASNRELATILWDCVGKFAKP